MSQQRLPVGPAAGEADESAYRNAAAAVSCSVGGRRRRWGCTPRTCDAGDRAPRTVKFTLAWLAQGSSVFVYMARAKGMMKTRGIDLDISRGFGSVASAQAIASGQFDLGMVAAPSLTLAVAKGLPLISLGVCDYDSTVAANPVEHSEMALRWRHGRLAGEQFRVLAAIAGTDRAQASWSNAAKLVQRASGFGRSTVYDARGGFSGVIIFGQLGCCGANGSSRTRASAMRRSMISGMFIVEAMALFQWGQGFKLNRAKAGPVLDRENTDFWTPPLTWSPPEPKPGWPRDGRVQRPALPPSWAGRVGKKPPTRRKKTCPTAAGQIDG